MGRKRKRCSVDDEAVENRYAGGWRQSAGPPVREVVHSSLAASLVMMWAWGLMSATAVQKQAALAIADVKAAVHTCTHTPTQARLQMHIIHRQYIHTYTNSSSAAEYGGAYYIYIYIYIYIYRSTR